MRNLDRQPFILSIKKETFAAEKGKVFRARPNTKKDTKPHLLQNCTMKWWMMSKSFWPNTVWL